MEWVDPWYTHEQDGVNNTLFGQDSFPKVQRPLCWYLSLALGVLRADTRGPHAGRAADRRSNVGITASYGQCGSRNEQGALVYASCRRRRPGGRSPWGRTRAHDLSDCAFGCSWSESPCCSLPGIWRPHALGAGLRLRLPRQQMEQHPLMHAPPLRRSFAWHWSKDGVA